MKDQLDCVLPQIRWRITLTDQAAAAGAAVVPDGYGLAWRSYAGCYGVYMPVPMNKVCGAARTLLLQLQRWGVNIQRGDGVRT